MATLFPVCTSPGPHSHATFCSSAVAGVPNGLPTFSSIPIILIENTTIEIIDYFIDKSKINSNQIVVKNLINNSDSILILRPFYLRILKIKIVK